MPTARRRTRRRPRAKDGGEARRRRANGSFAVTTYNILDGRQEGLYSAARALKAANVDIAVVQETKFLDTDFATKWWAGYEIKTAAAGTTSCGGVALLAQKNDWARVENAKGVGTNVLSFELVLKKEERFFVVGCYFPPFDKEGKAQWLVEQVLRDKPAGSMPLVIGDLNANLDAPRSRREEVLAQNMGEHGLGCASRHFQVRHGRHLRGRWTYRTVKENAIQLGDRRWVRSRPDHMLIPEEERKRIMSCQSIFLPYHSNHRALVVWIWGSGWLKRYIREQETLPVQSPKAGEQSEGGMFTKLADAIDKPSGVSGR